MGGGHSMFELVCDTTVLGGSAGSRKADKTTTGSSQLSTLMSLDRMQRMLTINRTSATTAVVSVEGGMRLIELNKALALSGLALYNMGMIQEQSISGLIATGTHGTGIRLASVSNNVAEMDIVLANGTLITCSKDVNADIFKFARIHLGLFGVVVRVSIHVRNAFNIHRHNRVVTIANAMENFEANIKELDHYSMWWVTGTNKVLENRMTHMPSLYTVPGNAPYFDRKAKTIDMVLTDVLFGTMTWLSSMFPPLGPALLHLIPYVEPEKTFYGPSTDILTHAGVNYHTVRYTEMEYFIPLANAMACLRDYIQHINAHMQQCPYNTYSPCRVIKGDDIPLSPSYNQPRGTFSISYVLTDLSAKYEACARDMEQKVFLKHQGRPHWGKVHYLGHEQLNQVYDAQDIRKFSDLVQSVDPHGKYSTERLKSMFAI